MRYYINLKTRHVHRFEGCGMQPYGSSRKYLGDSHDINQAVRQAKQMGYNGAKACTNCRE